MSTIPYYDRNYATRPMLDPAFQTLLARNGMTAEIQLVGDNYVLAVRGHDAPLTLKYELSGRQLDQLTLRWQGSNSNQKAAYKQFVDIVKNDYDCPIDFTHAKHANSSVAIGNHGYAVSGEMRMYGNYTPMVAGSFYSPFLAWGARQHQGYHLRYHAGRNAYVPCRPDGRVKPGEAYAGGYGFYYNPKQKIDALQSLGNSPVQSSATVSNQQGYGADAGANSEYPAARMPKPYDQPTPAVPLTSKMEYPSGPSCPTITKENLLLVYNSHGIFPDPTNNKMYVHSPSGWTKYDVTPEDMEIIMNPFGKDRFGDNAAAIEKYTSEDFDGKVLWDVVFDDETERYAPLIGEATGTWSRTGLESTASFDLELKPGRESSIICAANVYPEALYPAASVAPGSDEQASIAAQTMPQGWTNTAISADGLLTWKENGVSDSFQLPDEVVAAIKSGQASIAEACNFAYTVRNDPNLSLMMRMANSPIPERVSNIAFGTDSVAVTIDGQTRSLPLPPDSELFELGLGQQQLSALVANLAVEIADHPELIGDRAYPRPQDSGLSQLQPGKAWYAPGNDGRRMSVSEIAFPKEPIDGKYYMTAIVNGIGMTYEISEKDYIKAQRLDDAHKLMLFDKLCPDVEIRKAAEFDTLYYEEDIMKVCGGPDLLALAPDKEWRYSLEGGRKANVGIISADCSRQAVVSIAGKQVSVQVPEDGLSRDKIIALALKELSKAGVAATPQDIEKAKIDENASYSLSMQIDGKVIIRGISAKDYERFCRLSDMGRMEFAASKFSDIVAIKDSEQCALADAKGNGRDYVDASILTQMKPEQGWYSGKGLSRESHSVGMVSVIDEGGRCKMQAVIDGQLVEKDISRKDYDKFVSSDTNGKLKIFDKKYEEVHREDNVPTSLGMKILGGFMMACEIASYGSAVAADISQDLRIIKGQAPVPTMRGTVTTVAVSSSITGVAVAQSNYDILYADSGRGYGPVIGY